MTAIPTPTATATAASESTGMVARFASGQEWWDSIGQIPLDRVIFDPPPGTATSDDVIRLEGNNKLCELVDGTLLEKVMGYEESAVMVELAMLIRSFVKKRRLGMVTGSDGMMRLKGGHIRVPDIAFVSKARLPEGKMPTVPIPDLSPDLVVEILSESNTAREMTLKLADYFQGGTTLVWYVDPARRTIDVYTSIEQMHRLSADDNLTGGEVLPGFEVKVSEVFDVE